MPGNWRKTITDKAKNYLGMMRKAGRLDIGETNTVAAVQGGKARLVLLASDAAPNAVSRAQGCLTGHRALLIPLPYSKEELSLLLGKGGCSMAAVTDIGLASAFMDALGEQDPERYGEAAQEMKRRSEKAVRRKAMGHNRKAGRNDNE
ncbi:MAG: hypothetical protein RR314_06590 [Oscillospiraceae bacterium]